MKKIKSSLAALLLSLVFLSGCGMARDGYIGELPEQTHAPMESPYLDVSPRPSDMHRDDDTETMENTPTDPAANETPSPDGVENKRAEQ